MSSIKVIIITGSVGCGKSGLLFELIGNICIRQFNIKGIIARGYVKNSGDKSYFLYNIGDGSEIFLASTIPSPGFLRTGSYYFDPAALLSGRIILTDALNSQPELIIIDEIGPFELDDQGWAPSLISVLDHYNGILILTVREKVLGKVVNRFRIPDPEILNLQNSSGQHITDTIIESLNIKYKS